MERQGVNSGLFRLMGACLLISLFLAQGSVHAQAPAASQPAADTRNLAPGFSTRARDSRLVVLPVDMELFSIGAGGVAEPRADWTQAAQSNFKTALDERRHLLGSQVGAIEEKDMDELAEINALHGAVAQAIFIHHMQSSKLPTKNGELNWSMGDSVAPLRQKTGADYALFTWVRDSYATAERKATMIMFAMVGVGIVGGRQIGYASLVDLHTGQVVWFNSLARLSGDLRNVAPAHETVEALLKGFPGFR